MKKTSIEIEKQIIDYYLKEKKSTPEISKIFNLSTTCVKKILIRNNVNMRNISESKKGKKIGRKLPIYKIISLYVEFEKTSIEISKIIGCSKKSVLDILKENNIERRNSGWPKNYEHPMTKIVIQEYGNGRGMRFLSKKLKISYKSIRDILKKNNLIRTEERYYGGSKFLKGSKWSKTQRDNTYKTKTGLTFEEYLKKLPTFIKYRKLVTHHTNKQDLKQLENFNLRGKKKISFGS